MRFLDHIAINPLTHLIKGDVYPFIGMSSVSTHLRIPACIEYKEYDSGVKFEKGDTVIARIEPCLQNGKRFYCKDIIAGFGSTEFLVFRPKDESIDSLFLYYFMQLDYIKQTMINSMTGATGRQRVNTHIFDSLCIYPPPPTQRRIASILSAYDELIETNRRQIKLLEEAAQRLYKEWFVDFRFPGWERAEFVDGAPKGWRRGRADDFFEITIGKTPPRSEKSCFVSGLDGIPWASISDMGNEGVYIFKTSEGLTPEAIDAYRVKVIPSGTILLSFKLTIGRVAVASVPMCTNEAIAHFKTDNSSLREYAYLYLKSFEYDQLGNTSSIGKAINSKIVKSMPFVMPSIEVIEAFSKKICPLMALTYQKQESTNKAVEARDRLLPKLMSGEIEV